MNTISSISNEYANALNDEAGKKATTLGKDDFLKLLVAQMENQDPLNPTDPTEFTSQLSQFSSLEQLYNVNENLGTLQSGIDSSAEMASLGLIGKSVMSPAEGFQYQGGSVQLGYEFTDEVDSAVIEIRNESGKPVNSIEIDPSGPGEHFADWDGTDWFGETVPEGRYSFSITGYKGQEEVPCENTLVQSTITGVDLSDPEQTRLMTNNGEISLSDVDKVVSNSMP